MHFYAIFFPRVTLYNFFLYSLICGGLGIWVCCPRMGFRGWGFQFMGFAAVMRGLLGSLGWGSLDKHKRITLGEASVVFMGTLYLFVTLGNPSLRSAKWFNTPLDVNV